jgi:chaperonin GroES
MKQQLRPLFDQIVVREVDPQDMRRSGLVVPHTDQKPPQEGIVIAVGGGVDWWEHVGFQMPVKPGDHVMFPWRAGTYVEVDEERLLVMHVGALLGVLEEVPQLARAEDPLRGWAE